MNSPDPMVAKEAQDRDEILLTDDGDFGMIVTPKRAGKRFKKVSRVSMKCKHAIAVDRIAAALSLIEFEYEAAQSRTAKRIIIEIQTTAIRILR